MTLERARLSASFCLGRLRTQAEDLFNQQYPSDHPGPHQWLDLVIGVLDTAEGFLEKARNAKAPHAQKLTRDATMLGAMAYKCLRLMEGTSTDDLPYPIVMPLQRWLTQLGLKHSTFFRAEVVGNYELRPFAEKDFSRIRSPSRSLSEAVKQVNWPFLRITVPSKAFAIIPHFSIVAHEIGHALFPRVSWNHLAFASEQRALIGRVIGRFQDGLTGKKLRSVIKTLLDIFNNWFEELAADAFALYLTGPAIFFSLGDFFQLLGAGYGLSNTHPAHDLRRRALFTEISRGRAHSFAAVFKSHTGEIIDEAFNSPLLVSTPSKSQIYHDALNQGHSDIVAIVRSELHESMKKLVPIIYRQVRDHLRANAREAIYTPRKLAADLGTHLDAMLAGIPPIEIREGSKVMPTEFASILNVGWAALLTKLPELKVKTGPDKDKLETVHDLLLKAVELSEARRLWEGVK